MHFISTSTGRIAIGAVGILALIAGTAPLAAGAGGDNAGPAVVAPDDTQVAKKDRWVVVDADGTIDRGKKYVSAANLGTGSYEVIFDKNVRECGYLATIGLSGDSGASEPGFITTVGRATDVNGVFITTHDADGAAADLGFHLYLAC